MNMKRAMAAVAFVALAMPAVAQEQDNTSKPDWITAMNQPLVREDLMKVGAKEVLGKPIRLDILLKTVKAVLGH